VLTERVPREGPESVCLLEIVETMRSADDGDLMRRLWNVT
jgi:hypothetical protein